MPQVKLLPVQVVCSHSRNVVFFVLPLRLLLFFLLNIHSTRASFESVIRVSFGLHCTTNHYYHSLPYLHIIPEDVGWFDCRLTTAHCLNAWAPHSAQRRFTTILASCKSIWVGICVKHKELLFAVVCAPRKIVWCAVMDSVKCCVVWGEVGDLLDPEKSSDYSACPTLE